MREIKFRGLSVNGDWYIGLLSHSTGALGHHVPEGWYISNKSGMPWAYNVRPETVGQFTGHLDKNRKEIYEGDIVNIHDPEEDDGMGPQSHLQTIEFNGGAFMVVWDFGEYDMTAIGWAIEWFNSHDLTLEIVGNIYEHPNLLNPLL